MAVQHIIGQALCRAPAGGVVAVGCAGGGYAGFAIVAPATVLGTVAVVGAGAVLIGGIAYLAYRVYAR